MLSPPTLVLAAAAGAAGAWDACAGSSLLRCPGPNATCCPMAYSGAGWGCCMHPNAVCCEPTISNSGACCPAGSKCSTRSNGTTYYK